MHLNHSYTPGKMVWMRVAASCLKWGRQVCLGAWSFLLFITTKEVLTRPQGPYFIGSKWGCNDVVAAFLKCYPAYTSSSDVLCSQSQAVFPLACTYLSCLLFFNPCSSGLSDNFLAVCCCQGFRVQVLYHIPQQQQYVQSQTVLLRTTWHKDCICQRKPWERQNYLKRLNASQCFWAQDVFLDQRQDGEHSPFSLFEISLSLYTQQAPNSYWNKPSGIFPTCRLKWAVLTDCQEYSPPFRQFWINADRPHDYIAHEIIILFTYF